MTEGGAITRIFFREDQTFFIRRRASASNRRTGPLVVLIAEWTITNGENEGNVAANWSL
jgi:hypothetical protein